MNRPCPRYWPAIHVSTPVNCTRLNQMKIPDEGPPGFPICAVFFMLLAVAKAHHVSSALQFSARIEIHLLAPNCTFEHRTCSIVEPLPVATAEV